MSDALALTPRYVVASPADGRLECMAGSEHTELKKLVDDLQQSVQLSDIHAGIAKLNKLVQQVLTIQATSEPPIEAWYKRWSVLLSLVGALVLSVGTWWLGNDRAMTQMATERKYEREASEKRFGDVESRIAAIELVKSNEVEKERVRSERITRIETIVEMVARREGLRVPPPVDEGSP